MIAGREKYIGPRQAGVGSFHNPGYIAQGTVFAAAGINGVDVVPRHGNEHQKIAVRVNAAKARQPRAGGVVHRINAANVAPVICANILTGVSDSYGQCKEPRRAADFRADERADVFPRRNARRAGVEKCRAVVGGNNQPFRRAEINIIGVKKRAADQSAGTVGQRDVYRGKTVAAIGR